MAAAIQPETAASEAAATILLLLYTTAEQMCTDSARSLLIRFEIELSPNLG